MDDFLMRCLKSKGTVLEIDRIIDPLGAHHPFFILVHSRYDVEDLEIFHSVAN